jgi:hypothetical protein
MKITFVGVGIAGLISSISFTLYPLGGWPRLEGGDLFDTLVLLGFTFGAVLFVGFASGPNKVSGGDNREGYGVYGWRKSCPRCSSVTTKKTSFCPKCGLNLNLGNS